MSKASEDLEFVLIAEAGILEAQAMLLCESIRYFAGTHAKSAITVVSPRSERRPSPATIRRLGQLDAEYLPIEIASSCPEYGTSYRVHALAHIERRPGPRVVVQLDSDTLFLAEPDLGLNGQGAAARPVDMKGMCTTGASDPFDNFWRDLCLLVGAKYDQVPTIMSTVDRWEVKASYNGGLVVARRSAELFQRTEEIFSRLVAAQMKPWTASPVVFAGSGTVSGASTAYWGTSQAAFSLAAVVSQQTVRLLPDTYNFPFHLLDQMTGLVPRNLVHLHYHGLFSQEAIDWIAIREKLGLPSEVAQWLRSRLPLRPPDLRSIPEISLLVQNRRNDGITRREGKPAAPAQRQAILVLGMHRSGTSALTGAIGAMGATLPKTLISADSHNLRGYFESRPLVVAHDAFLRSAASTWDDWRKLDQASTQSLDAVRHRDNIRSVLVDEFGEHPLFIIKDPRICRFVPLVASILNEMNVRTVAVLAIRNPLEVAYSLNRRDGMPVSKAFLLWLRHVLEAEYETRSMRRSFIVYDQVIHDGPLHLKRLADQTGTIWPVHFDQSIDRIKQYLRSDLHHQRFTPSDIAGHPAVPPMVRATYQVLDKIATTGEASGHLDQLDSIRLQFDIACELFDAASAAGDTMVAQLHHELAAQMAEVRRVEEVRDTLFLERNAVILERNALAQQRNTFLLEKNALLTSRSWRFTAPLRWIRRLSRF